MSFLLNFGEADLIRRIAINRNIAKEGLESFYFGYKDPLQNRKMNSNPSYSLPSPDYNDAIASSSSRL